MLAELHSPCPTSFSTMRKDSRNMDPSKDFKNSKKMVDYFYPLHSHIHVQKEDLNFKKVKNLKPIKKLQ